MFCHKCGSKSLDAAAFCPKCGTKLIKDEGTQVKPVVPETTPAPKPVVAPTPPPVEPVSTVEQLSNATTKSVNKSRKWVIIGCAAVVVVAILATIFVIMPMIDGRVRTVEGTYQFDGMTWGVVDKGRAGISLPSGWKYRINERDSRYYRQIAILLPSGAHYVTVDVFHYQSSVSEMDSSPFVFNDGYTGSFRADSSLYRWVNRSSIMWVSRTLPINSTFVRMMDQGLGDTEEIMNSIARTLTEPNQGPQTISSANQSAEPLPGVYEPSASTSNINNSNGSGFNASNLHPNEITLRGTPIRTKEDAIIALGNPGVDRDNRMYYLDENIELFYDDPTGDITYLSSDSVNLFQVNGITLDKNRAELIDLLGVPTDDYEYNDEYWLSFHLEYSYVVFMLSDPDKPAFWINIYPNLSGHGDDGFVDGIDDGYYDGSTGYATGFRREDYAYNLSGTDLLRYPGNYTYTKAFFGAYEVVQVYEPKLYLVNNNLFNPSYIIIDDRGNNSPNAVVGEQVSVYGTFMGNETVTWTDGRSAQVPFISADLFILNNLLPTHEDLAQALVYAVNASENTYGSNSEYLGGARVRLNASIYEYNFRLLKPDLLNITPTIGPRADGYRPNIVWDLQGKEAEDFGVYRPKFADSNYHDDVLIMITGSITSVVSPSPMFTPQYLDVTIRIENIELYE